MGAGPRPEAHSRGGASFCAPRRTHLSSPSPQPPGVAMAAADRPARSARVPSAPVPAKWSSQPGRGAASVFESPRCGLGPSVTPLSPLEMTGRLGRTHVRLHSDRAPEPPDPGLLASAVTCTAPREESRFSSREASQEDRSCPCRDVLTVPGRGGGGALGRTLTCTKH